LEIVRNTNKILIPAFVSSDQQEILNMGKTTRQWVINGRYIGTEIQIKNFVKAMNDAEYNSSNLLGTPKQCYMAARVDIYTSGTATSTSTNKLVDIDNNFTSAGIAADMYVYNTTDLTLTQITARDSASTLSLYSDAFTSGESYIIYGEATPCFVWQFNVIDNPGSPGFIDYKLVLQEGSPL